MGACRPHRPALRRLSDRSTAALATAFVASSWVLLFHAVYARMYAIFLFTSLLSYLGLLAALMGRQRGLDVHVFDRVTSGPKPALVRDLGAVYHGGTLPPVDRLAPDVILECTGASTVVADVLTRSAPSGIVCLAGVSSGGRTIPMDLGDLNRRMVLENDVVFGSVNANRRHYEQAARALAAADREWLRRLITRRVPLARWREAFVKHDDDVKVVVTMDGAA